jgi:glucose-6-phosphate-specific signal transduction histidine kinase
MRWSVCWLGLWLLGEQLGLSRQRRVAFYPLGAAIALLLEETRSDWKRVYADRPFALAALLSTR